MEIQIGLMLLIGKTFVEDGLEEKNFCCDVLRCKGACCTLPGGRGAPLDDSELEEIRRAYPVVRKHLPSAHQRTIENSGLYEGPPGDRATVCHNDEACVFSYMESGVARCSFERSFLDGELSWRKPISCHLFPLRVTGLGRDVIRYEEIKECQPGRERGKEQAIKLHDFLEEPLTRKYGARWFREFREYHNRKESS